MFITTYIDIIHALLKLLYISLVVYHWLSTETNTLSNIKITYGCTG